MNRIPPEIDRLMWTIAEDRHSNAGDEFIRRYPVYREELLRRKEAVAHLRTGRPAGVVHQATIPRFTPRERVTPIYEPKKVAFVAGISVAAIAMAIFTVVNFLTPPTQPIIQASPERTIKTGPVVLEAPTVMENPRISPPPVISTIPQDPVKDPPKETPRETAAFLKPRSLTIKRASLKAVLQLLGAQSGLSIVLAPGMKDQSVSVDYHDMNTIQILQDLGSQYKFTAFDQGDGSVVVYPAVDPSGVTSSTDSGGTLRRIGG